MQAKVSVKDYNLAQNDAQTATESELVTSSRPAGCFGTDTPPTRDHQQQQPARHEVKMI